MKTIYIVTIVLILVGIAAVAYFNVRLNTQRQISYINQDIPDKDFIVEVTPTKNTYVFDVSIHKVNPIIRKTIDNTPISVDFVLTNASGKKHPEEPLSRGEYAEEVGSLFDSLRQTKTTAITASFRLKTERLKPGKYTLEPRVRILEAGEDAVHGPLQDGGSVAVPSGGSITVEIK